MLKQSIGCSGGGDGGRHRRRPCRHVTTPQNVMLVYIATGLVVSTTHTSSSAAAAATAASFSSSSSSFRLLDEDTNHDEHDDTRRMTCLQELGKLKLSENIALEFVKSMQMIELVKQKHHLVFQTNYTDDVANNEYRKDCEESAGGVFVHTSTSETPAVFDCYETRHRDNTDDNNDPEVLYNSTSTDIYINTFECFPPGEACQHYVDNPIDWLFDIKIIFTDHCQVRQQGITLDDTYASLISNDVPVPPPLLPTDWANLNDESTTPNHNADRQSKCMSAFKERIFDDSLEDLSDEAFYHAAATNLQLLQISSNSNNIIQREYYDLERRGGGNEDYDQLMDHWVKYEQLCEASNGRFDSFSGILDCVDVNGSQQQQTTTTTVTENAATCFPPTGCEGYTMEQWRIDTMMSSAQKSCTVRGSRDGGDDDFDNDDSPAGGDGEEEGEKNGTVHVPSDSTSFESTANETPPSVSTAASQSDSSRYFAIFPTVTVVCVVFIGLVVIAILKRHRHGTNTDSLGVMMTNDYEKVDTDNLEMGDLELS
jgi:hypothetical protein